MAKISKDNLGYLGFDFQVRLIAQIINDNRFAQSIIEILKPNYFEDQHLRQIVTSIIDAYDEFEIIPDIGSLEYRLLEVTRDDIERKYILMQLNKVQEANLNDSLGVQQTGMRFCKQQELKKSIREIQQIIEKGDHDGYDKCEEILKKALDHGVAKDDGLDVTDDMEDVLADDFRDPVRTGIKGLDEVMDGGLAKGELGIILAPFGVGKTTMMTKIANTAKNDGQNVLQIFFEDMPKVIQRKHLACWSGYELNDLKNHKEELLELVERKKNEKGVLKLKKFPSDGTTIPIIKQYIRKCISKGFRPDIILLDYIDCVVPSRHFDDVNIGEGNVMRQFETLLAEMEMVGWTAVQGNRSSIRADVVEADQMSGSIKKGMIGHFICSIAKTLDQKEAGTATMAILKSRFGKDGLIFSDIIFDNSRIQIEMGESGNGLTQKEYVKEVERENQNHVNRVLEAARARKAMLNGELPANNNLNENIN